MKKDELLTKKTGLEGKIKVFTDKHPLTADEQEQLKVLQKELGSVETEIENLP